MCCVLFEHGVLFCVLCLIVVPLPPGKNQLAVRVNNNNNNNIITNFFHALKTARVRVRVKIQILLR
jgi:hypothetical protein